jgi:putative iron-only hydrogenase system regulator
MDARTALIGIIVEDPDIVEDLNSLLHEYRNYVIGRMGLPIQDKGLNIISIVVDAGADTISTLAGKIGMMKGISVKTIYAKR